jgi:hypothetical protein
MSAFNFAYPKPKDIHKQEYLLYSEIKSDVDDIAISNGVGL